MPVRKLASLATYLITLSVLSSARLLEHTGHDVGESYGTIPTAIVTALALGAAILIFLRPLAGTTLAAFVIFSATAMQFYYWIRFPVPFTSPTTVASVALGLSFLVISIIALIELKQNIK